MEKELVIIVDFGGQYAQLIARRVRESRVYCEIVPYDEALERIKKANPKGIIFSGGPNSVYDERAPKIDKEIFELNIPILGICYGDQLIAESLGGKVDRAEVREYGNTLINFDLSSMLFKGLQEKAICWMSHTDQIVKLPEGFRVTASSENCPIAAMEDEKRKIFGLQFHPEVHHTQFGREIINNFLFNICNLSGSWTISSFVDDKIKEIKERIGDKRAICALSGGVDSSVAAVLVHRAIGDNLTCIFVDHGLLRLNEAEEVYRTFKEKFNMNLIMVNAKDRFLERLKGVSDPERKERL